jgi:serine protease Do
MNTRKLIPVAVVVFAAGAGIASATGCQHAAHASQESPPQAPAPFATPPVLPGTPDVATLAARVRPAVVNITTVHAVHMRQQGDFGLPGFGDMFPFFHQGPGQGGQGHHFGGGSEDEVMKQQALGSGFLIDDQGHVVTNAHVIDDADVVKVKLADDREFRAKVVGKDDRLDVAVLKLDAPPHDLPVAALGASEALRVGEYVVAIGNPFGLGNTVTMGIVSAKGRTIGAGPYDDFIQTDASINPGNSGGPLFNLRGQVVGINTAINPQGKGIGFAIPIDAVRDVLPQLLSTGKVARGRLGVLIQGMDEDLAKALGLDSPHGALVESVEPGSPAEKAGLKSGDVIVAIDGQDIARSEDLPRRVARHAPGVTVKLGVLHDKQKRDVDVTLALLKDDKGSDEGGQKGGLDAAPGEHSSLGISVTEDEGQVVVSHVASDGPADGKLRTGDVILEVAGQHVGSARDLVAKVHAAPSDKPVLLLVKRGDQSMFVGIERK